MIRASVLFARSDSVYRDLCFDVWDAERDARGYAGPWPVVAHPPCRAWGSLRKFAKPRADERELAFYAVDFVRQWGGVLEHPQGSSLWRVADLPRPGEGCDEYGGFAVLVDQGWFGHFAPKPTWLYVCGMPRHHVPPMPVADLRRRTGRTLAMLPADRERTPWFFADWLLRLAERCHVAPGRVVTPLERERLHAPAADSYAELAEADTSSCAQPLPAAPRGRYADLGAGA